MFRPVIRPALWLRLWLLVVAGLFPAHGAEPHPSLPKPVIPDCLGVNIHFVDPKPGELEMLAAAGFKWVRVDFVWAGTERKKGEYDFSAYDRLANALAQLHLHAVFVLNYGNPLYADPDDKLPFTSRAHTEEFREAFAKWAVAAMQHLQGRGYLWEMWNEPNVGFGKSADRVANYIALAKATGKALREAGLLGPNREALIGPAASTIDLPFLEACCKAGLLADWDAVSVHPYRRSSPETVEEEYRNLRLLLHRYAPENKQIPIISSECGYSDAWPGLDEELQGAYLVRQFLNDVANDVALSIWYDWHDDGNRPKDEQHHLSLVDEEYRPGRKYVYEPKPAYLAMRALNNGLADFSFNKRLVMEKADGGDHVLLFQNGKDVRVAAWTTRSDGHVIHIPATQGKVTMDTTDGGHARGMANDPVTLDFEPSSHVTILTFAEPNPLLQIAASVTRVPLEMTFEMPGQSPEFRFGFTNHSSGTVLGRIGQKLPEEDHPTLIGNGGTAEKVRSGGVFEAKLKVASRQLSVDGADTLVLGVGVVADAKHIGSPEVAFYQATRLIPADPLTVTRLPDERDAIVVRIENPSGRPWEGTAHVFGAPRGGGGWGKGRPRDTASEEVPLTLPKDVPVVVARIPLRAEQKEGWWRSFHGLYLMPKQGRGAGLPIADGAPVLLDLPNLQVVADGDPKVELKLSHEIEQPPGGPVAQGFASIGIHYEFGAGWKSLRMVNPTWPPPGEKDLLGRPTSLSVWIYGDGQGAVAHTRFVDSSNQFFQAQGPKVDWKGWRQVTFPMRPGPGRKLENWGGADDGQVHYPIELDSILVLENATREPLSGQIYVSAPMLNFAGDQWSPVESRH